MLAIEITLNIYWILTLVFISAAAGFIIRSSQIGSIRQKISELEKEIMLSHSEILDLQKEKVAMEQKLQNETIPVIPISGNKDEKKLDPLPDVAKRKILLGKQAIQEKS